MRNLSNHWVLFTSTALCLLLSSFLSRIAHSENAINSSNSLDYEASTAQSPGWEKYLIEIRQIAKKLKDLESQSKEYGIAGAIPRLRELAKIKEDFAISFLNKQNQLYYQLKEQREFAQAECKAVQVKPKTPETMKRLDECKKGLPQLEKLWITLNKDGEQAVQLLEEAEKTRKDADRLLRKIDAIQK